MSLPHTGRLVAMVDGRPCQFNGDIWQSADADLARSLNSVMDRIPRTHWTIDEIAREALRDCHLLERTTIISVEVDAWNEELPEGAID